MSRVLCYGWTGKSNVGDEVYPLVFPRLFPGNEWRFTSEPTGDDVAWCDSVVLGGGNILNHAFLTRLNALLDREPKPAQALSVGFADHEVSAGDFRHLSRVWVRDDAGAAKLRALGVAGVERAPDAAYALRFCRARGWRAWRELYEREGLDLYEKKVAVVLNGHLTYGSPDQLSRDALRFQLFAHQLAEVFDHTAASFLFLPFGTGMPADDRVAHGWVANKCKWHRKNRVLWEPQPVQRALDLLAGADAAVSMRYHSSVFCLVAGTPFVDVWHHDKNRGLLEVEGLSANGVPYWDFSRGRAAEALSGLLGAGGAGRDESLARAGARREQLLEYAATVRV